MHSLGDDVVAIIICLLHSSRDHAQRSKRLPALHGGSGSISWHQLYDARDADLLLSWCWPGAHWKQTSHDATMDAWLVLAWGPLKRSQSCMCGCIMAALHALWLCRTCPYSNRVQADIKHDVASRYHFCKGFCVLLEPHKSTAGLPGAGVCLALKPSGLCNLTSSKLTPSTAAWISDRHRGSLTHRLQQACQQ